MEVPDGESWLTKGGKRSLPVKIALAAFSFAVVLGVAWIGESIAEPTHKTPKARRTAVDAKPKPEFKTKDGKP